jgi:uncharacterized lipoprotein
MNSLKLSTPLLLALLLVAPGCATQRRAAYLQEKAGEHVYNVPLSQLWPNARELVKARGYAVREAPGGYEFITEWLQTNNASSLGTTWQRYLVRGHAKGPNRSSIEFLKVVRTVSVNADGVRDDVNVYGAKTSSPRGAHNFTSDHELAWELLRYMDAESAKKYTDEAAQQYP